MTKKLKIYSTMFVVALIVLVMSDTFHYSSMGWSPAPDNKMEFAELPSEFEKRDSIPGGVVSTGVPLISYEVNVQPWGRQDHNTYRDDILPYHRICAQNIQYNCNDYIANGQYYRQRHEPAYLSKLYFIAPFLGLEIFL